MAGSGIQTATDLDSNPSTFSSMIMADSDIDIIENSALSGITIRKTIIKNCVLRYVEIHTSTISNSTMFHCNVLNSTIEKSVATETKIHESKFTKLKMNNCTVTTSPLALRKFPPEIREMIFGYCTGWKGKTPVILVALRGDLELYREAIKVFYDANWYSLGLENFSGTEFMSKKAVENIHKLHICSDTRSSAFGKQRLQAGILPAVLEHCKSLRMLHLTANNSDELLQWVETCLERFPTIEKTFVQESASHLRSSPSRHSLVRVATTLGLEHQLGVRPKLNRVWTGHWETWVFEAPKGENLKWKDN